MKFLFGSGWWILWHIAFYAAVLLLVVLTLVIFAQDMKAPGQKPDTMSPGSILVFMIVIGLAALTLVNGVLFTLTVAARWHVKALIILGLLSVVVAAGIPLNFRLASEQSRTWLYANIAYAIIVTAGNLVLMWFARTLPRASVALSDS
jgi:hypothetical protein